MKFFINWKFLFIVINKLRYIIYDIDFKYMKYEINVSFKVLLDYWLLF